jgi:hypothetical protein
MCPPAPVATKSNNLWIRANFCVLGSTFFLFFSGVPLSTTHCKVGGLIGENLTILLPRKYFTPAAGSKIFDKLIVADFKFYDGSLQPTIKIHFSLKIPSQLEEIAAEINLSSKSRKLFFYSPSAEMKYTAYAS